MIHQIIILTSLILNLGWLSFLAYKGEKNMLLIFAIIEAILAVLFALTFQII